MGSNTNLDGIKRFAYFFCLVVFSSVILPNIAFIADASASTFSTSSGIGLALCNVVNALQGTMGKAIATIGVVVLGIGLFMGKLSWPLALATAIGIGLIFGAGTMVTWLGASGSAGCGS